MPKGSKEAKVLEIMMEKEKKKEGQRQETEHNGDRWGNVKR